MTDVVMETVKSLEDPKRVIDIEMAFWRDSFLSHDAFKEEVLQILDTAHG
jgi:hypothetical protein